MVRGKKKPPLRALAGLEGAADEDEPYKGYAKLLWLDPGGTTGWSIFVVHPDALVDPKSAILANVEYHATGQIAGAGGENENEQIAISLILDLVASWPGITVGTESFRLRQLTQDTELLTPVRINAALRYAMWAGNWGQLHEQPASLAKRTATDERLKEWGYYNSHSGPHARDADRHGLTFLRRAKERAATRLTAWPQLWPAQSK